MNQDPGFDSLSDKPRNRHEQLADIQKILAKIMHDKYFRMGRSDESLRTIAGVEELIGIPQGQLNDWITENGWISPKCKPGDSKHAYEFSDNDILKAILIAELVKTYETRSTLNKKTISHLLTQNLLNANNRDLVEEWLKEKLKSKEDNKRPLETEGWEDVDWFQRES